MSLNSCDNFKIRHNVIILSLTVLLVITLGFPNKTFIRFVFCPCVQHVPPMKQGKGLKKFYDGEVRNSLGCLYQIG
jgi:hypothetical protein